MVNDDPRSDSQDDHADIYGRLAPMQFYRRDGARLTGTADPSMVTISNETIEHHRAYHRFDKAHLIMLIETELIPSEVGQTLLKTLLELESENEHLQMRDKSEYGPHAGEAYLIDEHGEDGGGWIHLGRSTRDLREVAIRIVTREKLLEIIRSAVALCTTLLDESDRFEEAVMPSYTRLQHAQVTTFASHLLSWEQSIERSLMRLQRSYQRVNVSPAGTAAGTGTTFPIDRERVAELLGFDEVANSATDVNQNSDIHLSVMFDVLVLLHSVASVAEQLLMWSSEEFNYIELPDEFCGTSSIMPQKKNPLGLVKIQNDMKQAVSTAIGEFVSNRSLDGRASVDAVALETAIEAVSSLERIIAELSFDCERAEERVYRDWALATDLAGLLVAEAGLSWRSAHQICAILCRQSQEGSRSIEAIDADDLSRVAAEYLGVSLAIPERALSETLDADQAIRARGDVIGSPAPEQVRRQRAKNSQTVQQLDEWALSTYRQLAEVQRTRSVRAADLAALEE